MNFEIRITRQALKDIKKLTPKQKKKLRDILIEVISVNPFEGKKLVGNLIGNYSIRLNLKDRIIYSVDEKNKVVYVKRAKTHYGN
ncbi:MAG: type II toxin-antitoxin system mRNA interferase toxin, RelE/StbE family [Spirochaetales bacterium]|jgi:Txe/YoeB family toxin of toxin-antitoxin system|nr:type II toxin-antitoxin system mRNA interferase toxin, RelE/StbE family [Spirochaetales bacterium]